MSKAVTTNLVQSGLLLANIDKLMKFLENHCHDCPEFAAKFQRLSLGTE